MPHFRLTLAAAAYFGGTPVYPFTDATLPE
jgi:hypothetical protein